MSDDVKVELLQDSQISQMDNFINFKIIILLNNVIILLL